MTDDPVRLSREEKAGAEVFALKVKAVGFQITSILVHLFLLWVASRLALRVLP